MQQDKIFDEDVKSYLLELGMEQEQIRELRKKKLKEYAIFVLNEIILAIKSNDLESIKKYVCWSPAGDCMGSENAFIDFGGITPWHLDIAALAWHLDIGALGKELSDDSIELIKGD